MSPEFNFIVKANLKNPAAARRMQDAISAFHGVDEVWIAEHKLLGSSETIPVPNNTEISSNPRGALPTYGHVIEAWRNHQDMKLSELSRRAGVSQPYLTQVELNTIKRPSERKLDLIAQGLGVDPRILILRQFPPQVESGS